MDDLKLKTQFDEAFAAALKWREKRAKKEPQGQNIWPQGQKTVPQGTKIVPYGTKTVPQGTKSVPGGTDKSAREKELIALVGQVRITLRRSGSWTAVQRELAMEAIAERFQKVLDKEQRKAVDAAQLPLPGFEYLPKLISRRPVAVTTVKSFMAYADKYEKRSERDLNTLEEVRRLAKKLKPFIESAPNLTVAEAIERLEAAEAKAVKGLALVVAAGGKE